MKVLLRSTLFTLILISSLVVTAQDIESLKADAVTTYADIVFASYEDSLTLAIELQNTIDAFTAEPTEETLEAAKEAWLAAREPYGQTEAYRFYAGPIDDADGPEGALNAWPLDESYIDYVEGNESAGIIQNVENYPEITADLLISLNEEGGEENISLGYHAIEFLLWGQDLSEDSAGMRPVTDFTDDEFAQRRADYLTVVTGILIDDLQTMVDAWAPDAENYRAEFESLPADEALTNILTGIGILSKAELAGERIFTAHDNQDQEDEHSCFSDNTHRDIITNFMGIQNVYLGSYTRPDGTVIEGVGLSAIVDAVNSDLNTTTIELLTISETNVNDVAVPFDQAIINTDSRPQVLDTVFGLMDLGDQFALVASELGLTISTDLPE